MKLMALLFLICAFSYGQSIRPNVNPLAKELTYKLTKDSLKISSKHNITSVVIRSGDFRRYFPADNKSVIISLKEIPNGYYTIIAITNRKIITFNLSK